ncbi:PREDICTED: cyclin-O [Nanorana parkeri]|uniref:cyclin-O n=1 Tax=Nanorana parkeri TaxID=125878 RepID=UPI00085442A2|nr:PREDICTED: cyclin-O [Nanorana parkeri]
MQSSVDMVTCNVRQPEQHLLLTCEGPLSPKKRKREESTPKDTGSMCDSAGCSRRVKRAKYTRHRKQTLEARSCDSGVCDLYETPSPSPESESCRPVYDGCEAAAKISDTLGLQNFRDYGEECYVFKKSLEEQYMTADCMAKQPQLKPESRCKLISWLIPVHKHFKLSFESLCFAINILDRFLACTPVATDCFQLVGVTSLLIACKQVETRPPRVKQLLALCCDTFSREQLRNLECIILLKLRFQLAAPTIHFFLQHFSLLKVADGVPSDADLSQASRTLAVAKGIAELSLADYAFNSYPPSLMAVCCLALSERMLCRERPTSVQISGYSESQLQECMDKIDLLISLNRDSLHLLLPDDLPEKNMDLDN